MNQVVEFDGKHIYETRKCGGSKRKLNISYQRGSESFTKVARNKNPFIVPILTLAPTQLLKTNVSSSSQSNLYPSINFNDLVQYHFLGDVAALNTSKFPSALHV
ncbi:hypothetical protein L195_g020406 [Trifolium pratense]|uniref:Uncharacterized protein n=1 Tax=Trifolium pratense TaxID=57577 RepID=A0A2K3N298_TRIPR|nr:hypothetical protein L195_g020406 [Trifolium pratense]